MPGPKSSYVYRVPDNLELKPGCLVEMPLGRRKGFGVVVTDVFGADQLTEIEKGYSIKPISKLMDEKFSLSANELQFYVWMSQYYHYSLGLLVHDCLPPMMKRPRPLDLSSGRGEKIEEVLSVSQQDIFQKILSHEDTFWRHYIHGVTGSGKSLIYLHLIQQMIASGKSVLFMLPEINLTPQFVDYFKKYLSCTVIAYHSALSDGEKYQVWCHLMEQQGPVMVLGVRSSIFLPISQLGLVIVDEEHDASFKQTDRCPYNARDLAIKKAQIYDVPIVMGSATPAVENFQNFKLKPSPKTSYYEIRKRVRGSFPNIELLDTRNFPFDDPCWPLLPQTIKSIQEAFDLNEQVLVFVNRLGFANFVQCPGCGHTFKDPNT
jgi:primosomal protein N' (replication factor Y)